VDDSDSLSLRAYVHTASVAAHSLDAERTALLAEAEGRDGAIRLYQAIEGLYHLYSGARRLIGAGAPLEVAAAERFVDWTGRELLYKTALRRGVADAAAAQARGDDPYDALRAGIATVLEEGPFVLLMGLQRHGATDDQRAVATFDLSGMVANRLNLKKNKRLAAALRQATPPGGHWRDTLAEQLPGAVIEATTPPPRQLSGPAGLLARVTRPLERDRLREREATAGQLAPPAPDELTGRLALGDVLTNLSDIDREILTGKALGESDRVIARRTGLTVGAMQKRLQRLRRSLKQN
jgi:hypothetical protein